MGQVIILAQKKVGAKTDEGKKTSTKKKTASKKSNGNKKSANTKKSSGSTNKNKNKNTREETAAQKKKSLNPAAFEAICIIAVGFAALVIFSLFFASDTIFGEIILTVLRGLFGTGAYVLPFAIILSVAWLLLWGGEKEKIRLKAILCLLLFVMFTALFHVICAEGAFEASSLISGFVDSDYVGGGLIGGAIGSLCMLMLKRTGSVILIVTIMTALCVLISGKSIFGMFKWCVEYIRDILGQGFYDEYYEDEYDDYDEYEEYDEYDGYEGYDEYDEYDGEPVRRKKAPAAKRRTKAAPRNTERAYEEDYYSRLRKEKSYKDAKLIDLKEKTSDGPERRERPDNMAKRVRNAPVTPVNTAANTQREREKYRSAVPDFLRKDAPAERRNRGYIPEFLKRDEQPSDTDDDSIIINGNSAEYAEEDAREPAEEYFSEESGVQAVQAEERGMQSEIYEDEEQSEEQSEDTAEPTAPTTEKEYADTPEKAEDKNENPDLPPWDISEENTTQQEKTETQPVTEVPREFRERLRVVESEDDPVKRAAAKSAGKYKFPKLGFLEKNPNLVKKDNREELITNSHILEETLKSFKIDATVTEVSQGPTVTRYELLPAIGTKVKSIANLDKDLAMRLAAESIIIEAPIPGKMAVGIEIPNAEPSTVYFSEIVGSKKFQASPSKLTFGLGKDVAGNVIVKDIAKAPHFLIAGATNSGKSVCINTLINCILYKASPDEIRLIMVDPKMVELNVYNGIPHLLIPVVTDPHKASAALNWACTEMMRRYKLCADVGVRNLDEYNDYLRKKGEKSLYKIIIIIDELADLMLVAKKEVEGHIQRLTQLARAAGIHLIVATQRPSADVITGVIKSNIPSRIAFSVAQAMNSRIILDESGAEKLIGKGDMLVKTVEMDRSLRVQGAFISNEEIKKIVDYIKTDEPQYDLSVLNSIDNIEEGETSGAGGGQKSSDPIIDEVIAYIVKSRKASTSLIQRQFQIGYNRAARIIDELEDRGLIGPENGSKPRAVLMDKSEWREYSERRSDYI